MVDDDDFVFDNEETVIAVSWEDLNKSREGRNANNMNAGRNHGVGSDREVHVIHARHVPGRQYRLLDRRLLLRGYGGAGLGLNRSAGLLRILLTLRRGTRRLVLLSVFRRLGLLLCRLRRR